MNNKILPPGIHFLTGNVATAEAALIAGCRFYAGYPITPSSDLMHHMARRMVEVGGIFIQTEDEIAAMNMVLGASAAGMKAMTATSGPGLSLMEEALDLGFMLELPAVVVDVQRVGPSTGIPTLGSQGDVAQAIWGSHGDRATVVYAPSNPQECFDMTIKAFNAAEKLRMPVLVLSDEFVAHSYGKVVVPNPDEIEIVERARYRDEDKSRALPFDTRNDVPLFADPGKGFRFHYTGLVHDERGYPVINEEVTRRLISRLINKVRNHRSELVEFTLEDEGFRGDTLLIVYGSLYRIARIARRYNAKFRQLIAIFRPCVLYPEPDQELRHSIRKLGIDKVVVAEMNFGQYLYIVKNMLQDMDVEVLPLSVTPGFYPSPKRLCKALSEVLNLVLEP